MQGFLTLEVQLEYTMEEYLGTRHGEEREMICSLGTATGHHIPLGRERMPFHLGVR